MIPLSILTNLTESLRTKESAIRQNAKCIENVSKLIVEAFKSGKKLLLCGNGGSAADSQHMAAEFVGRFQKERQALPAIALTTDTSALTALVNDYGIDSMFARQVEALGEEGDILLGISTSGNSQNVICAFHKANEKKMMTIALTGCGGGIMKEIAKINIIVPSKIIARIQETHLFIEHLICDLVEKEF